jgi:hypothetical protein
MARPLKGSTNRKPVSARLEPAEKALLVKWFGGVQSALDQKIKEAKKLEEKSKKKPRQT